MADDGSVVFAGYSQGDILGVDTSVLAPSTYSAVPDEKNFVAYKLDSEGTEVWRWQVRL